jgi:hypothetical protein
VANDPGLTLSEKRAIVAHRRSTPARWIPTLCRLACGRRPVRFDEAMGVLRLLEGGSLPSEEPRGRPLGSSAERARRAERLRVLRAAITRRNSVSEGRYARQRLQRVGFWRICDAYRRAATDES